MADQVQSTGEVSASGGSSTWGGITGTLSNQTDLQSALDAKESVSNKDTDGTLAANSDTKYASQKATKTYADAKVSDTAYNATSWDSVTTIAPSKNAVRDQVEIMLTSIATKEVASNKDATGGYAGLTLFKINFKNVANTFTSFFTNSNTAARTYTFPDRDGTIADDTDLALKMAKASNLSDVANTTTARSNLGIIYPITFLQTTANAPLDATTYYIGVLQTTVVTSESTDRRYAFARACTIVGAEVTIINQGAAGTSEQSTIFIRVNNTTSTNITTTMVTTVQSPSYNVANNDALNISIAAGDFISVGWTTPTWATNPGNCVWKVVLKVAY